MTTLALSLNKSILVGLLLAGNALAQEELCTKKFDVLSRTEKSDKYIFVNKELVDLKCNGKFEGKYFRIVESTGEEPIAFDNADADLVKKAANTYYHLTLARNFWVNEIKSDYVRDLSQITIRLNITNAFSSTRHYMNEEQVKNYNNAWTVPAGETPSFAKEKLKWGKEIWFSPMKKIENRKQVVSKGNNPVHESLVLVKDPIIENQKNSLIYGMLSLVMPTTNQSLVLDDAISRVGTIAVMMALVETSKHMDKWFMQKWYYVDTAMVPEIIYHEYAHIAMSDTMKTVHSVPVIEGMADYFAARIATSRQMYKGVKGYSNNNSKDTKARKFYHPYLEGSWNSTSDFTLSLLWMGYEDFKLENANRAKKNQPPLANFDEIVHNAHFDLTEDADIANDLTSALLKACESNCDGKRAGINTLNRVFEKKGFN